MTETLPASPLPVQADFCDLRPVKSRKVMQLIFEVPIEAADSVIASLGGFPRPDQSRWVGIVRLAPAAPKAHGDQPPAETPPLKGRWTDLKLPARAALLCKAPEFQKFLATDNEADAAYVLRQRCRVQSRAHIEAGHPSGDRYLKLETEYFGTGQKPNMPEPNTEEP